MNYDFESRLDRAFKQRIYLMNVASDTNTDDVHHNDSFNFVVMGSTGKPYNVNIKGKGRVFCDCPDHSASHKLCKHLLFVLIRVLRIPKADVHQGYFVKRGFLTTAETIAACFDYISSSLYKTLDIDDGYVKQRAIEKEDYCPICFEELDILASSATEKVVYCKSTCGKSVHLACFNKWTMHKGATCVYCKANWV